MRPIVVPTYLMLLWALDMIAGTSHGFTLGGKQTVVNNLSCNPSYFIRNDGQWSDSILYRANAGGTAIWLTRGRAYYQIARPVARTDRFGTKPDSVPDPLRFPGREADRDKIETIMISEHFVGSNPNSQKDGDDILEYKCNYFCGNAPSKWRSDVPTFRAVIQKKIYPGIDLKYYIDGQQMKYDFVVLPGADPSLIQVQYDGIESLSVDDIGDLMLEMPGRKWTERAPSMYQIDNGMRRPVAGRYRQIAGNSFGFAPNVRYDPQLPLIIEPGIGYLTCLGGTSLDQGVAIQVDRSGAAYVVGVTNSADFPTWNSADSTYGGEYDGFVSKLSPQGTSLVYSTYFGGLLMTIASTSQ